MPFGHDPKLVFIWKLVVISVKQEWKDFLRPELRPWQFPIAYGCRKSATLLSFLKERRLKNSHLTDPVKLIATE